MLRKLVSPSVPHLALSPRSPRLPVPRVVLRVIRLKVVEKAVPLKHLQKKREPQPHSRRGEAVGVHSRYGLEVVAQSPRAVAGLVLVDVVVVVVQRGLLLRGRALGAVRDRLHRMLSLRRG